MTTLSQRTRVTPGRKVRKAQTAAVQTPTILRTRIVTISGVWYRTLSKNACSRVQRQDAVFRVAATRAAAWAKAVTRMAAMAAIKAVVAAIR
jgi:hypothetical protein